MTTQDNKKTIKHHSRHVGEEILCARWGSYGTPVLLYPTAGGDAEECERFKMLYVLRELVDAGKVKVYACDSVGGRALSKKGRTTEEFAKAQCQFDRFVADEFVPWIRRDCESDDIGIVAAGASIGAFNALAALCRHPDLFHRAICMSGTYDLTKWLDPPFTSDFYYSSPVHFLPNLGDSEQLSLLRKRFVLLAHGNGRWESPEESWKVAQVLGAKGIPNRVDEWGKDHDHDWGTWREMLPKYLGDPDSYGGAPA